MDFSGKRLLLLGGAAQCKKIVEAAHDLGIYVIINDIAPNPDTKKTADETLTFSLYDYDSLLTWCKENPVDGILNYCVDAAQHPYQRLCEELKKPCFGNARQFYYLTDKNAFREMCRENGVDLIPDYTEEEIANDQAPFPLLIKPAESSGSRGASVCRYKEEVPAALEKAKSISLNGEAVIEKYMEGYQDFTVTYVFADGKPYLVRIGDRYLGKIEDGLNRQCIATICPSKYTDVYLEFVHEKVVRMLGKLGIKNGPVFLQGFMDGHTVRFYDPGFRFPGGEYDRLYRQATEVPLMKKMVTFALTGDPIQFTEDVASSYLLNGKTAIQLTVSARPGTIKEFTGLEEIRKAEHVIYASQKAFVGDTIPATGDIKQRIAEIALLLENDPALIYDTLDDMYRKLHVLDEEGKDMVVSKVLDYLKP